MDETVTAREEEHGSGHGSNMLPLLFIIIALIIGAATRQWLRKSPLPYTVSLLLLGLILGIINRVGWLETWNLGFAQLNVSFLSDSLDWAGAIDPHLILYVFLPTLIFEAAFAMDVHTFRKSFTNAFLLAVPGIIIALLLMGATVMGLRTLGIGFSAWGWSLALLFGAVISATDPVAVVSLLKELGASKKLGTLIEGESLLNDGTAIVIFMVFFLGITGAVSESSPVIDFLRVALGGTLIGLVFGWITINWVRKVFNDALIEITVVIAAAYLTFFVAEYFFHVSGVLGLVAIGLVMAGIGRTRISPEVEHFLHEFWELAAFIANTLIFIIVGVVIANQARFSGRDLIILLLIYISIHIVRAIVITLLYPFMKRIGYGLPKKNAYVLWYGALRGAIGLALALIVAGEPSIPQEIRDQFLFLTAGIVTLTLLINATTIKYLVKGLGLTKIPPAKQLMMEYARKNLRQSTENSISKFKKDRFLNRANWDEVMKYLPEKPDELEEEAVKLESTIAETRRRILEKEKSSYWSQFREGMLGAIAVRRLSDAINEVMDEGGIISLSERTDLEEEWHTPKYLSRLQNIPILGRLIRHAFFERLTVSYDSARGFVNAQEEALKLVENMLISQDEENAGQEEKNLQIIEEEINENRIHGLTFVRNLRNTYPEIYTAIATRQAIRSVLNYEKRAVERLLNKGRLDPGEAGKIIDGIEERMKRLMESPPSFQLAKPVDLLQEIEWLKDLDKEAFDLVVDNFQNKVFSVAAKVVKEGAKADGFFVIVRGQVKVTMQDKVIAILGPGNVVGEMAALTNSKRNATVTAESPLTVLWMSSQRLNKIINKTPELEDRLWKFACLRFAENLLKNIEPYALWEQKKISKWLSEGTIMKPGREEDLKPGNLYILVTGTATSDKSDNINPRAILQPGKYEFDKYCRLFVRKMSDKANA